MIDTKEYTQFFRDIKSQIAQSRNKAIKLVNNQLINLYWSIGKTVLQRQEINGWGKSVVDNLASDLKTEYPETSGFSASNIWRM